MKEFIDISTSSEFVRTASEDVLYITSDGNYSYLHFTYGGSKMVNLQLGQMADLLDEQLHDTAAYFVRVGRGLIVNCAYIIYINPRDQQLELINIDKQKVALNASYDALKQLKDSFDGGKRSRRRSRKITLNSNPNS